MAGEESTVGVTVQQYLAEERTITDPTLTSTRSFSRRLNTVKTRFIIPYSFFGEDVMTAINPPKQNTSGQFELILTVLQHLLHYLKN
jgi:hypothetical protein